MWATRFQDKLKNVSSEKIWAEYCGFLELDIEQYMTIQRRLMLEQLSLWKNCSLGKHMLRGAVADSADTFRGTFPLTTYSDYADTLLMRRDEMLPDTPTIWIQTTWEGGRHPVKLAPYTPGMLNTFKHNIMSCMILATSSGYGKFDIAPNNTFLYGLAPLPYATGLLPRVICDEVDIEFLPSVREAEKMSFSECNKLGFKLGLSKGIDYFFGLGSVVYYVSLSLSQMGKGDSGKKSLSPTMAIRYLRAKSRAKEENRALMPKDFFKLKGFMVAGTDNNCYRDELEQMWGIRPLEVFAGTEPTCVGCETWNRDGMYFYPDACFYEFLPEDEAARSRADPSYQPRTLLMDEVVAGEKYELVVSVFKGGAFMRYRVGDMYRCLGIGSSADKSTLPRFAYIDRTPDVIDIAGFTRISEVSIDRVVKLSGLSVSGWAAAKEFTSEGKPFLHMYVELESESLANVAVSREILRDQLSIYFKYIDSDYKDLKRILGMDPLEITILRCGSFEKYTRKTGRTLRRLSPPAHELKELITLQELAPLVTGRGRLQ